jgi:hypothetical protein
MTYKYFYSQRKDYEILIIEDAANTTEDHEALLQVVKIYHTLPVVLLKSEFANQANPSRLRNEASLKAKGYVICNTNPECFHKVDILNGIDEEFPSINIDPTIKPDSREWNAPSNLEKRSRMGIGRYIVCSCENVEFSGKATNTTQLREAKHLSWFDHPQHNSRKLHWFSAITKEQFEAIGKFESVYGDWLGYDDDDFKYKVAEHRIDIIERADLIVGHIDHPRTHQDEKKTAIAKSYFDRKWNTKTNNKIPIVILSLERPDELRDMVESIVRVTDPGTYDLIICDNGSKTDKMTSLLKGYESKHTVLYNRANMGFLGFNPGLALANCDYFILTDPDIILNPSTPKNWLKQMILALEEKPVPKIGLSLSTKNLPDDSFGRKAMKDEEGYKDRRANVLCIDQPCYYAPIDTTLAMYRRDTFSAWEKKRKPQFIHGETVWGYHIPQAAAYSKKYEEVPIRVGGTWEAEHGGWYFGGKYSEDYKEYSKICNLAIASNARWLDERTRYLKNAHIKESPFTAKRTIGREELEVKIRQLKHKLPPDFNENHPWWNAPSYKYKRDLLADLLQQAGRT